MKKIAILASGSGSNAEAIVQYFGRVSDIRVECIITNNPRAGVIDRAHRLNVPLYYYSNDAMRDGSQPIELLQYIEIDLVVLAGYMCLITEPWLRAFPDRIINIHPALLPAYGGKGMYGMNVHRAVIEAGEHQSGITIHLVDREYDHGRHLLQASCSVRDGDTPESLAARIHTLEHRFLAPLIEQYLREECQTDMLPKGGCCSALLRRSLPHTEGQNTQNI
ncbi:MAG: phosphoribosylglycinamide formyltransferase [Porphyromonadaceae bacterium]|nr:phosphoribosylglycinamide formyltransferase [Porphyromonadaceae bacterium]